MPTCAELVDLLDVEELDRDLYRGRNPAPANRPVLYGGHVAAQAVVAAARTVPEDRPPHSLHGYFLRPGQVDKPTILRVDRDRDGGSFSARHVVALQDGEVILNLSVSFHRRDGGVDFEAGGAPRTPPPGSCHPPHPDGVLGEWMGMFDFRLGAPDVAPPVGERWGGPTRMWCKAGGGVGDDPTLHASILTYVSDLSSGFGDLGLPISPPGGGPSLDHALWLHRPLDVRNWFLLDLQPLVTAEGRGFYLGTVYDEGLRRCASITQEMLTRAPR